MTCIIFSRTFVSKYLLIVIMQKLFQLYEAVVVEYNRYLEDDEIHENPLYKDRYYKSRLKPLYEEFRDFCAKEFEDNDTLLYMQNRAYGMSLLQKLN